MNRIDGTPGTIRTSDPQIRSLGRTVDIVEACYRKNERNAVTAAFQRSWKILVTDKQR
jgi:hypothetical protein